MIYKDYIRVLNVDMASERIYIDERQDLMPYLGGVGVAAKLLEENMRADLPPLAPEQPIVFAIGAMETVYPVITKVVAMFISPLTGELGESYAGGRMGMTMFQAGFDAIVITGRAVRPTYLAITDTDVVFRDSRVFWGTGSGEVGRHIREYEQDQGSKLSIIRIGEAGENLVRFACVSVDRYRHFGRLGLGAVFGSKQLKAISLDGNRSMPIQNYAPYFKVMRELYKKATESGLMSKYHDLGTPVNVEPLSAIGALPTLNLQSGTYEHADKISGEEFASAHLVRKLACVGCPVGCIHIGSYRRTFAEHGYEYESVEVGYDYELIFSLGSYLGIDNTRDVLELIEEVEVCGMDAMSTGVALGWATEALEKGLVGLDDTLVDLKFGQSQAYRKAVRYMSGAENEFYRNLGYGVKHASSVYGGEDFAMHIAGNEMAGYHTGYAAIAGAAVGARHSHLCNGGYSIDQGLKDPDIDIDDMANAILEEEVERNLYNSLIMCLFARKIYDRDTVIRALSAIGQELTDEDLSAITKRIYATKLRIKKALNFDLSEVRLPKRFFETPSMHGKLDEARTYEIIERYKEMIAEMEAFT
ncbi:MAG: aldehyde:ferredoxin oxidoreductase [Eubacteriaceae bacterium]|nr:aldehyde:ferredoxin oxidoreductase [Eubacteriaceae bacterium]